MNLENIKAGDEVLVSRDRILKVRRVSKVTATQIIVAEGNFTSRYRRKDGWNIGGSSWSRSYLKIGTPAEVQEARDYEDRQLICAEFRRANLELLTLDTLRKVSEALKQDVNVKAKEATA
jgi:hypothetical protein